MAVSIRFMLVHSLWWFSTNTITIDLFKEDFNVDHFVVECRRRVVLETLRDDLSVYLKILQSAMIELINKDYADFVNLSTNLVRVLKIYYKDP